MIVVFHRAHRRACAVVARTAALAFAFLSCDGDASSSIDVVVSSPPPGITPELARLRLTVEHVESGSTRAFERPATFSAGSLVPTTFRVAPERRAHAGSAVYRFRAEGIAGGVPVVSTQARLVYLPGRRLVLPLRLEQGCVGVTCAAETTCTDARCIDDYVPSCLLAGADLDECADGGVSVADADASVADVTQSDLGARPDSGPLPADGGCTCNDGIACTLDTCRPDGSCSFVADDNRCGSGEQCVPPSGCVPAALCREDSECDDANACTIDRCTGGECSGSIVVCPDDGDPCTESVCESSRGCRLGNASDGTPCGAGSCCGGSCVSLSLDPSHCGGCGARCGPSEPACLDGVCGVCSRDADCADDGLPCTEARCTRDGCVHVLGADACIIESDCVAAGRRNPANDCEECVPATAARGWSPRSGSCDDGSFCTVGDTCSGGTCVAAPRSCDDGLACTADTCSESLGRCESAVLPSQCAIDGACYAEGAHDPTEYCRVCDPVRDPNAWSPFRCGPGLFCDITICHGCVVEPGECV